ncbi:golvesin C-terminal-like domain-containing protein [Desmospora profundinema]|uniref:RHS repeat-associated protein n=1 Tax=Desmospora profundinema TaxID=1571184 RepID=A0ABU1IQZ5_9BACL|nr:DNRLRE domain-containing protein [Desmospora profundinema]MDR6227190.1 RHS repeat-associated protein [Desmospora profundinema]
MHRCLKHLRRGALLLFLGIFVWTSLLPAPVWAVEAVQTWAAQTDSSSDPVRDSTRGSILGTASPLAAMTATQPQKEEDSWWDRFWGFFESEEKKQERVAQERADQVLPRHDETPKGEKLPKAKKERELTDQRTENAKFFELSDGRVQAEIASGPVHYRDGKGKWQEIDTKINASDSEKGFAFANRKNAFHSYFGKKPDQLMKFKWGRYHLTMGMDGVKEKTLKPKVKADTITYPGVMDHTDLVYTVTSNSLKEEIVLHEVPEKAVYTFSLKMGGVEAEERKDGFIAFISKSSGEVVFTMPAPFMMDDQDDPESPHGKVWSDKVTQKVEKKGSNFTITVTADEKWLKAKDRKYPVIIDPTITIQPNPNQSQQTYILTGSGSNFNHNPYISVGTTNSQAVRGLLKFNIPGIEPGTRIDSATLSLYYDQIHTTNSQDVPLEVRGIKQDWTASEVNWNEAKSGVAWTEPGGTIDAGVAHNREIVDNEDSDKVSWVGSWPYSSNVSGYYGSNYQPNAKGNGSDTFTWKPFLTESGTYEVDVHYASAFDRASNAPYTVHHADGSTTKRVDQRTGGGEWQPIGKWKFDAGNTHRVVLSDDADGYVIADAIRLTKYAEATKKKNSNHEWHQYSVQNLVQRWVDDPQSNHGLMVKAQDESTMGQGGPRYMAGKRDDEHRIRPKLVITYGDPSVTLDDPSKVYGTGAELHWSEYDGEDFAEYQVHRSIWQNFTPSRSTLVAPVGKKGQVTYTDTTARPAPADQNGLSGDAYYYKIVVKTKDGTLLPSNEILTRLPKAGVVKEILRGAEADTTLSSSQPNTNLNRFGADDKPWLQVGHSNTYGATRPVLKFDLTGIPVNTNILRADLDLWAWLANGNPGEVEAYALTRGFVEEEATWNEAKAGTAWSSAGGDMGSTPLGSRTGLGNALRWHSWNTTDAVQDWVNGAADNHGFLLKRKTESNDGNNTLFLSSEAGDEQNAGGEDRLRPRMVIYYTDTPDQGTYYAPDTPSRMIPGDRYNIEVTLTNTTQFTWTAGSHQLSYHWMLPDGTDVTTGGNQLFTDLPDDVAPGETVTVTAEVRTPIQSDSGNKREAFVLLWDLYHSPSGLWLSEGETGIPTLSQNIIVEDPKSDQLGLEKFYQYVGKNTGAGSTVMNNLYAGNTVFSYNPIHNPGQGLASFVRFTYNSLDTSDSVLGYGWSLSATSLMRLGTPLDLHPIKIDEIEGRVRSGKITLTDGDGTSHEFEYDSDTGEFKTPPGVHLYLQLYDAGGTDRKWVMTRPDRTQFFFDDVGFLSAIRDKNGNEMLFTYEERRSQNKPTKFLQYITDPANRQSLTLEYYAKGDEGVGNNPHIIDKVKSITDIAGRTITFTYDDKGRLVEFVDGDGDEEAKTFQFAYNTQNTNKNTKLIQITDPRGNDTQLDYYEPGDPNKWKLQALTDRLDGVTQFDYEDIDGSQGSVIEATVTDAKERETLYRMNGFGNPERITNAKGETTELHWDADFNVDRLKEPNGAVTTWTYDGNGLPLTQTDAENNARPESERNSMTMEYEYSLNGYVADLVKKTSPEGRSHTFAYDAQGNLTTVTDPKGYETTYTYHGKGLLHEATDANGNPTVYGDPEAENNGFDPNGYPLTITDALGNTTETQYGDRGEVLAITDANEKTSTYTYDIFNRPLESKTPKDQDAGEYMETPAPVYDKNDNVVEETAPNGAKQTYTYDAADQLTSQVAPKDTATSPERKTTFAYDPVGNLKKQTEPLGNAGDGTTHTTTYAYDAIDQLTSVTNAKEEKISYDYDNVGNMVKVTEPKGNQTDAPDDFTHTYEYDLNHRVTKEIDAAGHAVQYQYDDDSNRTQVTDKEGTTTTVTYDERGLVSETKVPHKDGVDRITRYEYDKVGNQTKVITPRGTESGVDDAFTEETVYDELNRVKETIFPHDPSSSDPRHQAQEKTVYTYDVVGNVTKVSAPPSEGQSVRNDTVYTHFDNGWVKTSTDPWDIQASYDYNELGLQTKRTLTSAGGSTRTMGWAYYPDGKLKAKSDEGIPEDQPVVLVDNTDTQNTESEGNWPASTNVKGYHGINYQYNLKGTGEDTFTWNLNIPQDGDYTVYVKYARGNDRATDAPYTVHYDGGEETIPVNQKENGGQWNELGTYAFTEGNDASIVLTDEADGTVIADAVKLVRQVEGEPTRKNKQFEYTYDVNGHLVEMTDTSDEAAIDIYRVYYTELNQVEKVEEVKGSDTQRTTTFAYDANGNPVKRTHDGEIAEYAYDGRNLVEEVTHKESADDADPKVTTYTYTPNGQKKKETKANGNTVDYTYYLDGLFQHQVEKKSNGNLVNEHTLTYNANGHRTKDVLKLVDADGNTVNSTLTYEYDPRDRVTKYEKTGDNARTETYVHDANSNVVEQNVDGTQTTYSYDRNRLLSATVDGASVSYNYDPFGRLDTATSQGKQVEKYKYDGFDRIREYRKLEDDGSTTTTTKYTYDPLDRKVTQTDKVGTAKEKTTHFNYLGLMEDVISEEVADEITKSYQYTPWGERLSMVKHGEDGSKEDSFYGYNTRTDVEVLTDENGNTRATYGYTAYGENDSKAFTGVDKPDPNNPDQEIYNPYRYSAKRFDPATGQYDMGFRDYDPGINRFLTRDMYNGALADMSLGMDPWTMNRYAFTGGNPVSRVELDGHDSICAPPLSCNPDHIQDAEKREAYDKEREALRQEATEAIAPFADLTWLGIFADTMSLIGGKDFWTGESKPRSESAANLAMTPVKPFKAVGSVLGFGARGANRTDVKFQRWKKGDAIDKPLPDGGNPDWGTVQSRYWKNRWFESKNTGEFETENLRRMKEGNAPLDFNPRTGNMESRELHHVIPRRHGGDNSPLNLRELTPDWHAEVDPYRHVSGVSTTRGIR